MVQQTFRPTRKKRIYSYRLIFMMEMKLLQPLKARSPMEVTESGMVIVMMFLMMSTSRRVRKCGTRRRRAPRLSLAGRLRPARGAQHHASPPLRLRRLAASVLLPRVELAVPLALHRLEADSEGPPLLRQHLERALCQPSVRTRCRKSVPQPPLARRRLRSVV